jgi:hypothetical protein
MKKVIHGTRGAWAVDAESCNGLTTPSNSRLPVETIFAGWVTVFFEVSSCTPCSNNIRARTRTSGCILSHAPHLRLLSSAWPPIQSGRAGEGAYTTNLTESCSDSQFGVAMNGTRKVARRSTRPRGWTQTRRPYRCRLHFETAAGMPHKSPTTTPPSSTAAVLTRQQTLRPVPGAGTPAAPPSCPDN